MALDFLHQHKDFADLIRIVSNHHKIAPSLIEKDYWIMHCLYGLQQTDLSFELKGGTSLSKGFGIIERFSEDIDIRIEPPKEMGVATNPKNSKAKHKESRRDFYNWLAETIKIEGIESVERDHAFDDEQYRSGGIRLEYHSHTPTLSGVKNGILLELGFDQVTPNIPKTISSWAYEFAKDKVDIIDNRTLDVACYNPGYTFVEKLQTISTKFRKQQEQGTFPANFMRHYYDVYCLLKNQDVQDFIGTQEYLAHKQKRFPKADNQNLNENEAFLLNDKGTRAQYRQAYDQSSNLYYYHQPSFEQILEAIQKAAKALPL